MGEETGVVPLQAPPSISPFHDTTERRRFHVELKGERAVSWKKLLKTLPPPPNSEAPPGANPALEARLAPETALISKGSGSAPNRFSNVIEKIEKLYQGVDSDDEAVEAIDDDQYNTDDSFIDDEELDEYFAVDRLKTKHSGFFINKGKLENTNDSNPPLQPVAKKRKRKDATPKLQDTPKKIRPDLKLSSVPNEQLVVSVGECLVNKQPETQVPGGDNVIKTVVKEPEHTSSIKAKGLMNTGSKAKLPTNRKNILSPSKMRFKQSMGDRKDSPKLSLKHFNGKDEKPVKKTSNVKLALERAIEELKVAVAAMPAVRPSTTGTPETDHPSTDPTGAVRSKRLPREMKLKLAKVARLAAKYGQGKVPDECIERLMSFLGHLMQLKTLKRNLKEMVETALLAKQERDGRILNMKRDFVELLRPNITSTREKDEPGSFDDFQSTPGSDIKPRFKWDNGTEDRLRSLYELCVEASDLSSSSHTRKLYTELADLWPDGLMDKDGVKEALSRSRERTKLRYREMLNERDKRLVEARKKAAEEKKAAAERFDLNKRMTEVVPVVTTLSKDVLCSSAAVQVGKCAAIRAPKLVSRQDIFFKDKQPQQQQIQQVKQEESEVMLYKFRKTKPQDVALGEANFNDVKQVPSSSTQQRPVEGV